MSKPTVIQIEARGDAGNASSRARVLLAKQPWVRRTAGCDIAARDAAAKFFGVAADQVTLSTPFAGIYSARLTLPGEGRVKPWRARRSAASAVPDTLLIEEDDATRCPIAMVHAPSEPETPRLWGEAKAALVCAAPTYHLIVGKIIASMDGKDEFPGAYLASLIIVHSSVEAVYNRIPQPPTGGES